MRPANAVVKTIRLHSLLLVMSSSWGHYRYASRPSALFLITAHDSELSGQGCNLIGEFTDRFVAPKFNCLTPSIGTDMVRNANSERAARRGITNVINNVDRVNSVIKRA